MINAVNQRDIGLSPSTLKNYRQNGTEEGQEVLSQAPKMYMDKLELSGEGIKKSDPEMYQEWIRMNRRSKVY